MNTLKVLGVSASIVFASTGVMAKQSPIAKQLAGPAEEIELMQKAAPESSAVISKHAMIEVNMNRNTNGQFEWQKSLLIDGENPKILLFTADNNQLKLNIKSQNFDKKGEAIAVDYFSKETSFGMGGEQFPATQFDLQNLKSGRYDVAVKSGKGQTGYLMVSSDSPYRLKSFVSTPGQLVGDVINVNASAFTTDQEFTMVKSDLQLINSSYMRITSPDGHVEETSMFDDGSTFDKAALDGEFNGQFRAEQPGMYQVQVVSQGITPTGKPFFRTVEHVIPVIESDLVLNSKSAQGQYTSGHKIDLSFAVDTATDESLYRVVTEVWGTQIFAGTEKMVPVAWLSSMAGVNDGEIKLQLDDRWLLAKNVTAPYALKNLRVEDANHYISVINVENLPLNLPAIDNTNKASYIGGFNESMLQGEKPAALKNVDKAAGGKLMLVHGYCSGDVWGPVQSQFSNNVRFADYDKNRSHDEFARLIDSYGDNFPSFGVVAHSQGGAAALHLYTYYWSGLDNAGSGRLIQSVGTPYLGTPLAGAIATLGQIFGIQCGSNSNLTVSGGNAWLAGIPTWARSKVNYYTTSFTTKWWRPDWCNFASDIILSDPEDGVTEKSRGQVSGAVNRGHKTGQCHVDGMRDMAQTRDSGRNSTMSSNAAR